MAGSIHVSKITCNNKLCNSMCLVSVVYICLALRPRLIRVMGEKSINFRVVCVHVEAKEVRLYICNALCMQLTRTVATSMYHSANQ